jgi:endo-1,4-beta-D-glucanase Y
MPAPLGRAAFAALLLAAGGCTPSGTGPETGAGGANGSVGSAGSAGSAGVSGGSGTGGAGGGGGIGGTGGASGSTGAAGASGGGGGGAGGVTGGGGSSGVAGGSGGGAAAIVIPGAGSCTAPTGAKTADAAAAYQKWKTDLVTSDGAGGYLRVKRPNSNAEVNSTVSEGIAYGMLLAVFADDQPTFDKLWQYAKLWPDANGLINAAGTQVAGTGGATDADEDMAFALIMADARWKGHGSLTTNYIDLAKTQIGLIWAHEVDHTRNDVLMPGDQFADGSVINISYFAPAFYRVFGRVAGTTANWMHTVDTTYTVIVATLNAQNGNATNGLVPAWSTPAGVPMSPAGQSMPTYHQLDSCRTPFRIGQDWCWNADQRALTYLKAIDSFYSGVTVAAMVDGYDLNGTPHPQNVTSGGPRAASFVGPAGVGAMATGATYATLRDQAYASVATLTDLAGSSYYQESWTALSLQMMTGVMRDLTVAP